MSISDIAKENSAIMLESLERGATEKDWKLMQRVTEAGIPLSPLIDNPSEEYQNPGIKLPPEVTEKISYTAWTGLSRIICEGWIQDQKWLISRTKGYDIGTPETIRLMIEENPTNSRGVVYVIQERVKPHEIADFIRLTSIGYLLRTNFNKELPDLKDDHGQDQLEGELKRYLARKQGKVHPAEVEITSEAVNDYCMTNGLNGAYEKFTKKLRTCDLIYLYSLS